MMGHFGAIFGHLGGGRGGEAHVGQPAVFDSDSQRKWPWVAPEKNTQSHLFDRHETKLHWRRLQMARNTSSIAYVCLYSNHFCSHSHATVTC